MRGIHSKGIQCLLLATVFLRKVSPASTDVSYRLKVLRSQFGAPSSFIAARVLELGCWVFASPIAVLSTAHRRLHRSRSIVKMWTPTSTSLVSLVPVLVLMLVVVINCFGDLAGAFFRCLAGYEFSAMCMLLAVSRVPTGPTTIIGGYGRREMLHVIIADAYLRSNHA